MYPKIKRASLALCLGLTGVTAYAQNTVKGTVKDASGEPMIGVTIDVDGKAAAITDIDGNFTIPNAGPSSTVKVSYIGYKEQSMKVGNQRNLNFVLSEDNATLNEVVVVGYGTMKKSDLTGSIASVNSEDLVSKGSSNVLEAMQGSVPGVNITQSTGRADNSMNIEIRGKSSINSSTTPLFIVDGVMCDNIDFLNEQDIEKIDVLKDASSTAIYGSRATAGVVMVTTKGGLGIKKGTKPSISYDGYYGVAVVSRMPDFQDAQEFVDWRFGKFLGFAGGATSPSNGTPIYSMTQASYNQAMLQTQQKNYSSNSVLLDRLHNGMDIDWPSLVTQDGRQQNHYLAVSGSNESVSYNIGLGYHGIEGVYKGDNDKKISFKASADARINKVLSAGFNFNMARIKHDYSSDNGIKEAYRMNPLMEAYDADGNIITNPGLNTTLGTDANQFTSSYNPLIYFENEAKQRETWRLLGNFYVNVNPFDGLTFKTMFSPTYTHYTQGSFEGTLAGESTDTYPYASTASSRGFGWTWDNTLTYEKIFNKIHRVNVMGLFSMQKSNTKSSTLAYKQVDPEDLWYSLGTGTYDADNSTPSNYTEWSMLSYALRANYTLLDRYMLTATVRWDGSSKFADGHRWGSFPSFALAWRISEEKFIKDNVKWLSNLKLRLSYGVTGNNNGIGNFSYQRFLNSTINYYPFGNKYFNGRYPNGIIDENLTWEKSHEWNLGLDFGFLRNRITGSIDLYNKKSTDLLYNVRLPYEVGAPQMYTNVGSVRNKGVEISATGVIIQDKNWNWTVSANWAHNSNEVLQINGSSDALIDGETSSLFVGSSVNNVYGYQWDGIVSDKDMKVPDNKIAVAKGFTPGSTVKESDYYYSCYGWVEGSPIVTDVNGDGAIDNNDKRVYRADPAWTGSLSTSVSYNANWGAIDFSASLYTKQHYWIYSNFYERYTDYSDRGRMRLSMDTYIPAGKLISCDGVNSDGTYINPVYQKSTHYGKYPVVTSAGAASGTQNSYWGGSGGAGNFEKISFTKIKNITLGYTFPKSLTQKFGCQRLRLYVNVTNPFVITGYKGFDPEWANASLKNDGPSTTTWQFGANIKF